MDRPRPVQSCPGHTSLTPYTQLFLSGYELGLDDLKAFRTHGSKRGVTPSTGTPRAWRPPPVRSGRVSRTRWAWRWPPARAWSVQPETPEGESPFDRAVWGMVPDGDLEEGISAEASSLAGRRSWATWSSFYDDDRTISIEGDTATAFSEDVLKRSAYGWHVQRIEPSTDGDIDVRALYTALKAAQAETGRPSIIAMRTIIAWPAPAPGTPRPRTAPRSARTRSPPPSVCWASTREKSFEVADEVLAHARQALDRGAEAHAAWDKRIAEWRTAQPERARLLDRIVAGQLPEGWQDKLPAFEAGTSVATRAASGKVLQALGSVIPELWGGSADLAGSNNTTISKTSSFLPKGNPLPEADPYGRTVHFGIREHSMAAEMNGIALHGNTRIYGGTFLVFSDYMRNAVRLSALMQLPVTYVWTHDSIGLGEDGPTHQPVEHLASLRAPSRA